MRIRFWTKGAAIAVAAGTLATVAGCDTNYYDSGAARHTTTTTQTTMAPPAASSTTTVTPNPDGSVTTTERTQRNY